MSAPSLEANEGGRERGGEGLRFKPPRDSSSETLLSAVVRGEQGFDPSVCLPEFAFAVFLAAKCLQTLKDSQHKCG